jgi:leucyl aminopeptidase
MTRLLDVTISSGRPPRGVLFVTAAFAGEPAATEGLPDDLARRLDGLTRRPGWTGETGQLVRDGGEPPAALCGLGPRGRFDERALRSWLARAVALSAGELGPRVAVRPPDHPICRGASAAAMVYRHLALAGYRFDDFRTKRPPRALSRVHLLPPADELKSYRAATRIGRAVAAGVATARDLANTPPNRATPAWMADRARSLARKHGLGIRVLGPGHLARRGMNAILAVGQGSANPPRLVRLEWGRGEHRVALVGKGVTFDTGGISIKPAKSMEEMKYDKSGACAVLGIVRAAAELDLPFRFRAYLPLAENMPSGEAYRPSDIVRCYNGKTVEVLNTDAEGRMILADALALAAEEGADSLVELSTLTGATVVALGHHGAALYTPDDGLAGELESAAADSGDRLWRMPLWPEFVSEMRGNHSDLKNISGRWGGANNAAAFLGEFVDGVERWAHLDIAGTAWIGAGGKETAGATGYGVALVLTWLLRRAGRL